MVHDYQDRVGFSGNHTVGVKTAVTCQILWYMINVCTLHAGWINHRVVSYQLRNFQVLLLVFFFSFFSCNWMVWSQKQASKTCRSSMKAEWMVAIVEDCNLIINCIFIFKDPTSQYFDKIISNRIYNFYFFHRQANIVWFPILALKIPS